MMLMPAAPGTCPICAVDHPPEPDDGQPIADPPGESYHQAVGDPNSRTFGPESTP